MRDPFCVRATRMQPLICVGCYLHYWVSCAINKGAFLTDIALLLFFLSKSPGGHTIYRAETRGVLEMQNFTQLT